jgi:hypothetical protein
MIGLPVDVSDLIKGGALNKGKDPLANEYTAYEAQQCTYFVDDETSVIKGVVLSSNSIHSLFGVKINSTLDEMKKLLGEPKNIRDNVKNTKVYTYIKDDIRLNFTVDDKGVVEYAEAMSK